MERNGFAQASTLELNETEILNLLGKPLTGREKDVLFQLLNGATNRKSIGRNLGIGPRTVGGYLVTLFLRFGVHGRNELIGKLVTSGLVIVRPVIDESKTPIGAVSSK